MVMETTVNIGPDTRLMYAKVGRVNSSRYVTIPAAWDTPLGTKLRIRMYPADGETYAMMIRNVSSKGTSRVFTIPYRDAAWAEEGTKVHVIAEVIKDDDTGREIEGGAEVAPADA